MEDFLTVSHLNWVVYTPLPGLGVNATSRSGYIESEGYPEYYGYDAYKVMSF